MACSALSSPSDAAAANIEYEAGLAFEERDKWTDALRAYLRSRKLGNESFEIYKRLAKLYSSLGYCGRAHWYALRAAKASNFSASSLEFLARAQYRIGELDASLCSYRQAMEKTPLDADLHSSYLFTLLHDEAQTPQSLRRANEEWIVKHCSKVVVRSGFKNTPHPTRRLRLGYISAEFWESMGRFFLLPVIESHDHRDFQVYCYHASEITDATTEEFRKHADFWRDISDKSAEQIRELILQDEIDVLVERSSHIAPWRSGPILQQRAAPVQVAYLDYPCTTGCRNIDYFVTDRWTTPDDHSAQQFAEREVFRLPSGSLLFSPFAGTPDVTSLPAAQNGYLTFGLLQRPAKYNDRFWDSVGAILQHLDTAKLLLQHGDAELEEPAGEVRKRILAGLEKRGIARERVRLIGSRSPVNHLRLVSKIDIALDTFPYSGATTTCFCLWMGVPVVTLPGSIYASRVSGAILSRLGMGDWVANSLEDYVRLAIEKAGNFKELAQLRAGLRQRMRESTVCRPGTVVRELEEGYRSMWQKWCAEKCS